MVVQLQCKSVTNTILSDGKEFPKAFLFQPLEVCPTMNAKAVTFLFSVTSCSSVILLALCEEKSLVKHSHLGFS